MPKARARHILVKTEKSCSDLKKKIEGGADFADVAKQHSECPSGKSGGDLGEFGRGQMVPEFDSVVFTAELGKVHGPIKTQFGWHLIEITKRVP
jgi:peptidyl-prolyl cis-trans isomerase C